MDKVREAISGGMAVCFYIMFILFAWYVAFQMSLEFYTGENVGMPENPKIIADEFLEPTMRFVVCAVLWIALYAFVFGNALPLRRSQRSPLQRPHGPLSRLKGIVFLRRSSIWTIPWWMQLVLLVGFSWWIRMQVVQMIGQDTVQIVDFERVFRMSLQEGSIEATVQGVNFYRAFPNWALYVKLIHCLNVHFGAVPLTGILWNAVASCASVGMLYAIVYLTSGQEVLAILSALLFSTNPFYLYYEILLSPDFTFIFLCLLALLILAVCWRFVRRPWLRVMAALPFGGALALSGFFKSIDKILIIALAITVFLRWIAKGKPTKQALCQAAAIAAAFAVAYTAMVQYGYHYIDRYVSGESNRDVSPYFLNVGLNADHGGQWSQETLSLYLDLILEHDYDFAAVNREMKENLSQMLEEQNRRATEEEPTLWWEFAEYKLRKAWGNNEGLRFVMNTINEENPLGGGVFYEKYLPQVQAASVVLGLLMAAGGVAALLLRERKTIMVSALMVFGFALLLLLSEVQPRYRTVVLPFMAVVAAYGIYCTVRPVQLLAAEGLRRLMRRGGAEKAAEVTAEAVASAGAPAETAGIAETAQIENRRTAEAQTAESAAKAAETKGAEDRK